MQGKLSCKAIGTFTRFCQGNDLLIASHALALGLTLVTHNTREFSRIVGLQVEDWL